eukprot:11129673-Ditylum_brightwellii.AAC.1
MITVDTNGIDLGEMSNPCDCLFCVSEYCHVEKDTVLFKPGEDAIIKLSELNQPGDMHIHIHILVSPVNGVVVKEVWSPCQSPPRDYDTCRLYTSNFILM